MQWTALYLPKRVEGEPDPSKYDCGSEDDAWEYVYSLMCRTCKEERARVLAGTPEEFDSEFPACACEWMVLPTSEYQQAETWDELNEAAGWKRIWPRDEGGDVKDDGTKK